MNTNNTRIYLYHEDGYTLWVLVERLPQLLSALGDTTHPNSSGIHIFYRPSFGRADHGDGIQFGEPDLLIGTPQRVYHIECKPKLTRKRSKTLQLGPSQVMRHTLFQTYRRLWQKHRPATWSEFRTAALPEFEQTHEGRTMPQSGHLVCENLEFILRTLESCGSEVCDALLLFQRTEETKTPTVYTNPHGFDSIVMPLEMIAGSNFVGVWMTPPAEDHDVEILPPTQ